MSPVAPRFCGVPLMPGARRPAPVANGALHRGSGCTLGDIVAEWLVFAVPAVAVAFGYQRIFCDKIFAVWIVDYIFAYGSGTYFQ
jgi:hypothetical protein